MHVLGAFDATLMPADYEDKVVVPGSRQVAVVEEAFGLVPPLLCHAVDHVAFVEQESEEAGSVLGWVRHAQGNVVFVSALPSNATEANLKGRSYQLGVISVLIHEAAHAAHNLLDSQKEVGFLDSKPDPATWSSDAQALAAGIVASHRLQGGFEDDEWVRLHEAFVDLGLAEPYYGNGGQGSVPDAALMEAGFMSAYGGTKPSDDIAEMVMGALYGHYLDAQDERGAVSVVGDHACQAFRAQEGEEASVSDTEAAAFVKLSFLRDLGFLTDEAFSWCVGGVGARYNTPPGTLDEGFHVYDLETGAIEHSLTGSPEGFMGEREGSGGLVYFQMNAEGLLRVGSDESGYQERQAEMSLLLDLGRRDVAEVSWPRGIYRLQMPGQADQGGSRFIVEIPDAGAQSVWATDGYVLVVRASNNRIEGGIRILDTVRPFAPSPLPLPSPAFHTLIQFVLQN